MHDWQEEKHLQTVRNLHASVKNKRLDCIKQWQQLQDAKRTEEQATEEVQIAS